MVLQVGHLPQLRLTWVQALTLHRVPQALLQIIPEMTKQTKNAEHTARFFNYTD